MKKSMDITRSAIERSQRATEKSSQFTSEIIERSKKLRTPSTKVDKIGTAIGCLASTGLLFGGTVQIFTGNTLLGIGTLSLGAIATVSNRIHHHKITKNK